MVCSAKSPKKASGVEELQLEGARRAGVEECFCCDGAGGLPAGLATGCGARLGLPAGGALEAALAGRCMRATAVTLLDPALYLSERPPRWQDSRTRGARRR